MALLLYFAMPATTIGVTLIELTGPDRQTIGVNPSEIISARAPRSADHFARGTRCLLTTVDGKFIAVGETCETVKRMLEEDR